MTDIPIDTKNYVFTTQIRFIFREAYREARELAKTRRSEKIILVPNRWYFRNQKITLVRRSQPVLIYCADYKRSHSIAISCDQVRRDAAIRPRGP